LILGDKVEGKYPANKRKGMVLSREVNDIQLFYPLFQPWYCKKNAGFMGLHFKTELT